VLAASNTNFNEAIESGRLRRDLYYRLNVINVVLPPLRERREDISLLALHFLDKYAVEFNKNVTRIEPEAMESLLSYGWPGNVRELENIIESAVVMATGEIIRSSELGLPAIKTAACQASFRLAKAGVVKQFEKDYIQRLLVEHRGNVTHAAMAANKNRRAFWQLIQKHQIDVKNFR
jgi:two-component system response regulator GlrR